MFEFSEKSLKVKIDTDKCDSCESKACVKACRKYARGILSLDTKGRVWIDGLTDDEVLRLGTECLACEYACKFYGNDAILIEVPIIGLDEYLEKRRLR